MMPKRFVSQTITVTVCVAISLAAHESHSQDAEALAQRAYKLAEAEAETLNLSRDGKPLDFRSEPLLRWSNPVSGQVYGDIYIWTAEGRPEVIASIFKWFSPHTHLSSEFQSLSESSIKMTQNGRVVWNTGPGIKMEMLTGSKPPSERAFQRLREMRELSSQFKAEAVDRADANSKWLLRPLAKPIYRYQSESQGIVDGALFAYCQGNTNNPEVMLILEARKTDDKIAWYYGLGRQNSLQFRVYRNEELVWDVPKLAPPWPNVRRPEKPYFMMRREFE